MASNPYKDIMKLVNKSNTTKPLGEQFVDDIDSYLQLSKPKYIPSQSVKPSSLGGCLRMQYFILTGAEQDLGKLEQASMITIQQSGNDRHERLQYACQDAHNYNIQLEWVDPVEEVKKANAKGIKTVVKRRDGNEVLCYNEDYNASFKCDGIIIYKGKKMILEIKTEDHYKWASRTCAEPTHRYQAIFYSLLFGIDYVMFLYEDRNYTTRKAYFVEVTEEERQQVRDRIYSVLNYEKDNIVPAKTTDTKKCNYCNYKQLCRKYGKEEVRLDNKEKADD